MLDAKNTSVEAYMIVNKISECKLVVHNKIHAVRYFVSRDHHTSVSDLGQLKIHVKIRK